MPYSVYSALPIEPRQFGAGGNFTMSAAMRSERLPLSSLSRRALRRWFIFSLILFHGCAAQHHEPNVRLTPPVDQDPYVVGSDDPDWKDICLQRKLGDDPDAIGKWNCITIGELRAIVRQRLRADN